MQAKKILQTLTEQMDTFSQEEVDGMAAFYSSPAGRALIAKMPLAKRLKHTAPNLGIQTVHGSNMT